VADRDPELKAAIGAAAPDEPVAVPRANRLRRTLIMVSIPLLIAAGLAAWYVLSLNKVSTDNAYVRQDKVGIAPLINGNIVEIAVRENQIVKAGDLLFRIDPAPYRIALAQANAQLAAAQARLVGLHTDLSVTGADIAGAQEDVTFYARELQREAELMNRGFSTRARIEAAEHELDDARSKLAEAQGTAAKARAAMATGNVAPGVDPVPWTRAVLPRPHGRGKCLLEEAYRRPGRGDLVHPGGQGPFHVLVASRSGHADLVPEASDVDRSSASSAARMAATP